MGRIAAPYGVHGWMNVLPYTGALDALLAYPGWWIADDAGGTATEQRLVDGRVHAGRLIAKLEGVDTREAAARYRGRDVAVPRAALPDAGKNETYVGDLVGLEVVNRAGQMLGKVMGIGDNGAQPLLRVAGQGGGERLVPFVPAVVDEVDFETSRIVVDWELDY